MDITHIIMVRFVWANLGNTYITHFGIKQIL